MLRGLILAAGLVGATAQAAPPAVTDLVAVFDQFAAKVAPLPGPEQAMAFRTEIGPMLPGVYPRKSTNMNATIAKAVATWPEKRPSILAARDRIVTAYQTGTARFAKAFPGYAPVMPTYVIHSFSQMDGGTREIEGKTVLIFGADMIAALHGKNRIEPLVDHELFHTYHQQFFDGNCEAVWCQLWTEGLATYVAHRMTPGATDDELLLNYPRPIRPEVDPRMREAVCAARRDFDVKDNEVTGLYFDGTDHHGAFPPRFGYYVGYRIAERIGKSLSLDHMAKLPAPEARRRIERAMAQMARC